MFQQWFRRRKPSQSRPSTRVRGRWISLGLEWLEDRTVLSFFTPATFAVGSTPVAQATGDFNGDGRSDLVVVNQQSNTVSVLLGNGTFQTKSDFATGTSPTGVAVGDFNGEGKADIAVANSGSNSVSVLMGNGDGTFQPKTDITLTLTPVALTTGDFNGDGKTDIAVATENTAADSMTMLLGNGDGTFQVPVTTITATALPGTDGLFGGGRSSISTADFNGDGISDLVVVNNMDTRVPAGRFTLTFTDQPMPGTVSVLLGNGNGTFQAPQNFAVGVEATSVAVGDFNNDGRPDFAVGSAESTTLSVFMNSGGGNFSSSSLILGGTPGILAAGDFNGDGATDLAVPTVSLSPSGGFFSGVKVLNGQTGVGLQAGATYALNLGSPVVGDFNGDGHLDLAGIVSNALSGGTIEPWLNNGNGTFPAPSLISAAGVTLAGQATADFNGDGIPDLVSAHTGQVQLGLGDGRFGDSTALAIPSAVPSLPWTPMATALWTCWWATRLIRPARWPNGSIRPASTIARAGPSASSSPPRSR